MDKPVCVLPAGHRVMVLVVGLLDVLDVAVDQRRRGLPVPHLARVSLADPNQLQGVLALVVRRSSPIQLLEVLCLLLFNLLAAPGVGVSRLLSLALD